MVMSKSLIFFYLQHEKLRYMSLLYFALLNTYLYHFKHQPHIATLYTTCINKHTRSQMIPVTTVDGSGNI